MTVRIQKLAAYLLALQGIIYTASTVALFDSLSVDALRFAGTGLGWIFLALLNLSALTSRTRRAELLTVGANGVGLLYFVLLAVAVPDWRTAVAILLVLGCLVGSVTALRSRRRDSS
ncbi:MAG: hypothetical protein JSV86_16400 [Gemmatimonadota bacterium]|nr:MAG: hypothetical protein JSV86_16400 [Gemmatimonadota bacterium]